MNITNKKLKGYLSATFLGVSFALGTGCATANDAPVQSTTPVLVNSPAQEQKAPAKPTPEEIINSMTPEELSAAMLDEFKNNRMSQARYLVNLMEGIRALHVDEAKTQDAEKMISAAINGVLKELDPHSAYLTAKEFKSFQESMSGAFVGVGVMLDRSSGKLVVIEPIEGGPAEKAGFKADDVITHIDGKPVSEMTEEEALNTLRGEEGTTATVTIERPNVAKPFPISVTRGVVESKPVRSRMIGNDIAYVQLATFAHQGSASELRKHITDLQNKNPGMNSVILDLRYNGGGYVHMATQIIDDLLDSKDVTVSMRGRNPKDTQIARATPGDITNGKRIIILMNEGSASASELTAGALQDHKRAIVLGTQSFGKGTVQQVMPLPMGDALKITTGGYYSPLGRSIQNNGITPDILYVAPVDPKAPKITREADMANTLENKALVQDTTQIKSTCAPIENPTPVSVPKELQRPRGGKADFELICAVETLRNQSQYTVSGPYVAPAKPAIAAPRP
jgi:carboxyl-terminal processing protease